jgi:hypothetical protein
MEHGPSSEVISCLASKEKKRKKKTLPFMVPEGSVPLSQ